MNKRFYIITILIAVGQLAWINISAQEIWTMQACIDRALKENLSLEGSELDRMTVKEEEHQALRNMLPEISASSSYTIQGGRSVNPNTNEFVSNSFFFNDYSINSEMSLFQGFQKRHQLAAQKLLSRALTEEQSQQRALIALEVMQAYIDVLYFKKAMANASDQVKLTQENKRFVEKQIELGLLAGSEIHLAESALISDQLQVTRMNNQYQTARLMLMQQLNIDDRRTEFELESVMGLEVSKAQETIGSDSIYNASLQTLPLIRAQEYRMQSATEDLKQRRGMLFPSLVAFAGYGSGYFETNVDAEDRLIPFREQMKNNASQYYGLALNIPISDRWTRRSQVNQKKIDLLKLENQNELQKQELLRDIQTLTADLASTNSELELSKAKEATLNSAYDVAQKKYLKGLFSALDLDRAKNLYVAAQNEQLQLEMKSIVLGQTLGFYSGRQSFTYTTAE